MRIGLSKGGPEDRYRNYARWLERAAPDVETIDLLHAPDPRAALDGCDGLVLTGGCDVNPVRFGRPELFPLCDAVDDARDLTEFGLIERARERGLPILGICRGLQILNVALGGSLVADIARQLGSTVAHVEVSDVDGTHAVTVARSSLLHKLVRERHGIVNSAHHQAVDMLAPDLVSTAHAPDGVVEAVEWKDPAGKPFLLAVQWHPERMAPDAIFSARLAEHFLFEAESARALVR